MAKKSLIIVESPTKSKTLTAFLGKDYQVVATMGHIRDLPKSKLGVDVDHDFKPEYLLVANKKEAIKKLKLGAKKASKIFLATDPDREGEAIAWHVGQILKIPAKNLGRITFHEITKSAIKKALAHPGLINMQLVDAQQARRVLDRLVGYKLSPLLWRKIRRGLSAGRVQSVAVRLIVDREREREKFVPEEYWEIWAKLKKAGQAQTFLAQLAKVNGKRAKVENKTQADQIVDELKRAGYGVAQVEKKEVFRNPVPPFTTSTMQQRSAQLLRFSGRRTMRAAQSLYEKGLITYHRTDSVTLASQAITALRVYIKNTYGEKYLPEKPRFYKIKSKVAQEAHEAIRPTDVEVQAERQQIRRDEQRLYELIWKRAVASQMTAAIWDATKIDIQAEGKKHVYLLRAEGKVMKFNGWLVVYEKSRKPESQKDKEAELPGLKKDDELDLIKVKPEQKFTQPPPRYTEATLIKVLEEKGIGRPSTYAPIIWTIQGRQYVEKQEGKFQPTLLGTTVSDFLVEYFPKIMDYQFTAKMEDDLDEIANGKQQWVPVIREFYEPFEQKLAGVTRVAERVKVPTEATGENCPQCKKGKLVIRVGRFGKFISCSRFPDCKYTAPFTPKVEGIKCPKCQADIVIKKTKKAKQFYSCSRWPKCDWASWRKPSGSKDSSGRNPKKDDG
ncbi:MAG TPA: type I DNA topoisomerase [Nevskiaceae bacterium]|nr:type I DNA topoisomerase [Nevskiaceae bacterium]